MKDPEVRRDVIDAVLIINQKGGHPDYIEQEIMPRRTIDLSQENPAFPRVALGIKGRFSVGGLGLVSAFVRHEALAKKYPRPTDIEDAASAGQYWMGYFDWPIEVPSAVNEEVVLERVPVKVDDEHPVKLLAGIQVNFDFGLNDLVPTLVYHRNVGEGLQAVLKEGLEAHKDGLDPQLAEVVTSSDDRNLVFFSELAGSAMAQNIQADYI